MRRGGAKALDGRPALADSPEAEAPWRRGVVASFVNTGRAGTIERALSRCRHAARVTAARGRDRRALPGLVDNFYGDIKPLPGRGRESS